MKIKQYLTFKIWSLLLPVILVSVSATAQYCTTGLYAGNTYGCTDGDFINSFSTTGPSVNITNLNTDCTNTNTSDAYTDFSATMGVSANPFEAVNFTIESGDYNSDDYKIFVDWNQDQDFDDPDEEVYYGHSTSAHQALTGTFIVPGNALSGTTMMRVRCVYNDPAFTPCAVEDYGEIEDYAFTVLTPPGCTGVPNVPVASGPATVCSGASFTLTSSNVTFGSGISYEWQSFDGTNWNPIAGATSVTCTISSGQTAATDYRLVVNCANGGGQSISNTLSVGMSPFYNCYCSPALGTTLSSYAGTNFIQNVTVTPSTLNASSSSAGPGGYTLMDPNVAGNTAILIPGFSYTVTVSMTYTYDIAGGWIDLDQNGTYDAGEFISFSGNTGSFSIPTSTPAGQTGLRIRVNDYGNVYTGTDACMDDGAGETEDYIVTIPALTPCTGTPDPVTASAPANVCSGIDFMLTGSGMSIGTGITYDWQSFDGTNWNSLPGGTTPSFVVPGGQTAATDYRMVTTCANGGGQDISNVITVNMSPFYDCYCSPLNGTTLSGYPGTNFIESVEVVGTTLSSATSSAGFGGYTLMDATVASNTGTLVPGLTYTMNIGQMYTYDDAAAWADWDQSGTYDAGELITVNNGTATFSVPVNAPAGQTGLRVRVNDYGNTYGGGDACWNDGAGETEDYTITVPVLPPCAGTPDPATASGPASVCSGIDFTLTATGMTIGTGVTYEWQSFDGTNWNPVTGGSSPTFTVSGGQTAATDYRMVTTCANGGGQDISNTITVNMSQFYQCYCSPLDGSTILSNNSGTNFIESVEIPTTTLSSSTSSAGPGGYTLMDATVTANTATLTPGLTYTLNIGQMYTNDDAAAWADWDQSGTYDAGEFIPVNNGTATFSVPVNAPAGQTGLRVRVNDWGNTYGSGDACWDDGAGETEDYTITIPILPPCTGTPDPATAAAPAAVCSGIDFTLSATGMSVGTGIVYEWQSFDGTNWNAVTGGSSPTFVVTGGQTAATDYRLVTICNNGGGQDISNTVSVAMNPFYNCYCSPLTNVTITSYPGSNFITGVAIPTTTLSATSSSTNPNGYIQVDPMVSGNTGTLMAGVSYVINVSLLYPNYDPAAVWIDYDQSGTYDAGEDVTIANGTGSFMVPSGATLGQTGLRVRANDYGNTYSGGDACWNDGAGETEDYVITIAPAPACAQPNTLAANNVTATTADLTWVEAGTATQWTVQYGPQGFTPGTGTFVSVTTTPSVTIPVAPATVYDFYVRAICSASDSSALSIGGTFTTPCVTANGPYSQSFNTGSTPLCWTNAGPELWLFSTGSGPDYGVAGSTDHTGNGGDFAWVDGSGSGTNQDITLTAVPVDVSSFAAPNLSYYMKSYNTDDAALNKLLVQAFDGTDWINIDSVQMNMPSSGWYNRQVLLAPFSLPATVQIRFVVDEDNSNGDAFYNDILLDDVNIVDGPLAVGLGDIAAVNVHTRNRIDWNTINEITGDYFILERSADGRNFSELATVNAKGQPSTYSYWDEQPVSGVNYYRLKMMDAAGKAEYSKVVTATVKGANGFTVEAFPNPVTDVVTVKMYGTMGDHATVSISDITGKVIKMFTVSSNELKVNMGGMAQGIYLIKYADDNHAETLKVNKQ